MSLRDGRVIQLYSMNKRTLAIWYRKISGFVGSAVPPERWSKDDLVNAILEIEDRRHVADKAAS